MYEEKTRGNKLLTIISNVLSGVFSPLLVPTYAFALALWTTYLVIYPEWLRFTTCGMVFLITTIIPLAIILFLMRKGIVSDAAISKPSERWIPYASTTICYFIAALYLRNFPMWLCMFFVGAGFAAIIDMIINKWWKISAHATSLGGLTAVVLFIGLSHINTVLILPWLANAILISGAVCSARVFLGRHTLGQVFAGWMVGLIVSFSFMLI